MYEDSEKEGAEKDIHDIILELENSELLEDEKEALQKVKYRLMLFEYMDDDLVLAAHMLAKIQEAYEEIGKQMPLVLKEAIETKAFGLRQELNNRLVMKKKEYAFLEQKAGLKSPPPTQSSNTQTIQKKPSIWDKDSSPPNPQKLTSQITDATTSPSNYFSYEEALDFLESVEKQKGIKLGLDNMSKSLSMFGNPQEGYKIIHVTGTNGKGSTCAMIDNVLQSCGFKVGRYTSPHLIKMNERFMINGKEIPDEKFAELVNRIKPYLKKVELTYFEILTLIGFLYFKDEKVDFLVLEVGMGGRLDATNVCKPLLAAITNIDLEHTEHLGNTIKEIAFEKAGIIKENLFVVTGCEGEALQVISEVCKNRNAKLVPLLKHSLMTNGLKIGPISGIHLGLKGEFQFKNAEVALTSLLALKQCSSDLNEKINERTIKIGLANTDWPGRLDFVEENVILDSAHNPAGAKVLAKEIERLKKKFQKVILVFGAMKDKNISEMIVRLVPLAENIFLTKADIDRAEDPSVIGKEVEKYNHKYILTDSVKDAVEQARAIATPKDLVVVCGSIYVVGKAMEYLKGEGIL